MDSCDVLVIGGGAAGTAAALAASAAGARVRLVRRGPGATALSRGGWYTAPPHDVRTALSHAGMDLVECTGALPHPDGHLVRCEVAPASHADAAIRHDDDDIERTIVIGIDGLPSFHPRALAALWSDAAGRSTDVLRSDSVTLPGTPAAGWSPVALAALLDREPERLGRAIAAIVRSTPARRVILPAVVGLDDPVRTRNAVSESAGVSVTEALGSTPSIPGWRLDQAFTSALARAGVQVLTGSVTGVQHRNENVERVTILGDDGESSLLDARAYVLATGKYLGGGITANREYEEPALGCDVAIERFAVTIDDVGAALILTDPVRTEPQPVMSIGVRIDSEGRPIGPDGRTFPTNVYAAGTVRAGVETATYGLGAATGDGWAAGERAAAFASMESRR